MENKIVLGFPYAGAFHWLLSAEQHYKKSIKERYDGSHPYYITLFGKKHNSIIDETVSLTLLFDAIYLAPVDTYLPDREKYRIGDTYSNQKWGIYTNFDWIRENENIWSQIDVLLQDPIINIYLNKVPKSARRQILHEAINQIHISNKFDTAIFAISSYLKLCERIHQIISLDSKPLKTQSSTLYNDAIETVFELSSLNFTVNGLDEFAALKEENNVRKYATSFREYVSDLPNGNLDEVKLYEAMMDAINCDALTEKISGAFDLTSKVTNYGSFIPFVGTVTSIIGLGADAASDYAKSESEKNKWWLLAPEVSKQLTKKRIETKFNKIKGSR